MADRDDLPDEPRDRSFTPALEAHVERARAAFPLHSTDPNWNADKGGLPEPSQLVPGWPHCWCVECVRRRATWHGATFVAPAGTSPPSSTIDAPRAETVSSFLRAELEKGIREAEAALADLRRILERT